MQLPAPTLRSLAKLGADIGLARRKRLLTEAMMAERIGVARGTYRNVEAGDPGVGIGVYAMALFVLGLGTPLASLADASTDDTGLALDSERVPKRVRPKKKPQAL